MITEDYDDVFEEDDIRETNIVEEQSALEQRMKKKFDDSWGCLVVDEAHIISNLSTKGG